MEVLCATGVKPSWAADALEAAPLIAPCGGACAGGGGGGGGGLDDRIPPALPVFADGGGRDIGAGNGIGGAGG